MLSVETAKAVVEVPCPVSGRIIALHAQPGDRIEIGTPLIEFAGPGADLSDSGTVVGRIPDAPEELAIGTTLTMNRGATTAQSTRAARGARAGAWPGRGLGTAGR